MMQLDREGYTVFQILKLGGCLGGGEIPQDYP